MRKNTKCINIFEENRKDLNLYQVSILIILLITLLQISTNAIKYTQLSNYISSQKSQEILIKQKVSNNSSDNNKNLHTQECNINLSELEEASSIIGMKKIKNIYSDSNRVEIQGFCKDTKVLEKLSNIKNIRDFNIKSLQKEGEEYLFDVEYKVGGTV